MNVNLETGVGATGDAAGDRYTSIENVLGTTGNDTITGSADANLLVGNAGNDSILGGAGDDTIRGGAGNDILRGGAGIDTLDYSDSTAGVTVNLSNNTASGGFAQGDNIAEFENVTGSNFADRLTGDAADNVFDGRGGNDTISGGAGSDIAYFGVGGGRDTFDGGAGGGWTDTVIVDGGGTGPGQGGWTVILSDGTELAAEGATGSLDLGNDASGTIVLADGSEMTFDNLERISW